MKICILCLSLAASSVSTPLHHGKFRRILLKYLRYSYSFHLVRLDTRYQISRTHQRAGVAQPWGQLRRIGSLPSQVFAVSRTWSKMRMRVGVASAISMTVPGWPSLRK